jgi:hypothetical protein
MRRFSPDPGISGKRQTIRNRHCPIPSPVKGETRHCQGLVGDFPIFRTPYGYEAVCFLESLIRLEDGWASEIGRTVHRRCAFRRAVEAW